MTSEIQLLSNRDGGRSNLLSWTPDQLGVTIGEAAEKGKGSRGIEFPGLPAAGEDTPSPSHPRFRGDGPLPLPQWGEGLICGAGATRIQQRSQTAQTADGG